MVYANPARKEYLKDQIQGASPEKIISLLYDGAIQSLEESVKHIEDQDPARFGELIIRAQKIVAELMGSLKVEENPESLTPLFNLYQFIYKHLVSAHLEKNLSKIKESLKLLRHMRETWTQALDKAQCEPSENTDSEGEQDKPKSKPSLSFQA